jgi:hypothetical protein
MRPGFPTELKEMTSTPEEAEPDCRLGVLTIVASWKGRSLDILLLTEQRQEPVKRTTN